MYCYPFCLQLLLQFTQTEMFITLKIHQGNIKRCFSEPLYAYTFYYKWFHNKYGEWQKIYICIYLANNLQRKILANTWTCTKTTQIFNFFSVVNQNKYFPDLNLQQNDSVINWCVCLFVNCLWILYLSQN